MQAHAASQFTPPERVPMYSHLRHAHLSHTASQNMFDEYTTRRRISTPPSIDDELIAPAGSDARRQQKARVNPLLDPDYVPKVDATGLGYGRKHANHFRYISHWTSPEMHALAAQALNAQMHPDQHKAISGYRSKQDRGYTPDASGLGYGTTHSAYYRYIQVKRPDDILKLYPSRDTCEKMYQINN